MHRLCALWLCIWLCVIVLSIVMHGFVWMFCQQLCIVNIYAQALCGCFVHRYVQVLCDTDSSVNIYVWLCVVVLSVFMYRLCVVVLSIVMYSFVWLFCQQSRTGFVWWFCPQLYIVQGLFVCCCCFFGGGVVHSYVQVLCSCFVHIYVWRCVVFFLFFLSIFLQQKYILTLIQSSIGRRRCWKAAFYQRRTGNGLLIIKIMISNYFYKALFSSQC